MSEPLQTAPKPFGFVLMPFDDSFRDVFEIGIRESCHAAGAYCERVDEQIFDGGILERIYNQIAKADFIVADMTGRNANVFYEVGYAHALGKRTILITKRADDIPFDLKHFPHVVYGDSLVDLRDQLTKRVEWCVKHPVATRDDMRYGYRVFIKGKELTGERLRVHPDRLRWVTVVLENVSGAMIPETAVRVGFIVDSNDQRRVDDRGGPAVSLPDGRVQFLRGISGGDMLPGEVRGINFVPFRSPGVADDLDVTVRVYSALGPRDFPIRIYWPE